MNEIALTGCDESHFPIGALAAFGVLRVLTLVSREEQGTLTTVPGQPPRMSWRAQPRWTAVLHTDLTRGDVVRALISVAGRVCASRVWTTASDLRKVTPTAYRELLQVCDRLEDEELSTAFACEWPVTKDEKLMFTPFFMTSGQQRWFMTIRTAAEASVRLGTSGATALEEGVFGPWRYAVELSALGWDPATERQHALEAEAPTKTKLRAEAASVWLAAESLALFPCFGVGRSLRATCFDDARSTFFWPVWQSPLSYDAVRAMLRLPLAAVRQGTDQSVATQVREELGARGIDAVFASRRMGSAAGHGYYVFSAAELLWSR